MGTMLSTYLTRIILFAFKKGPIWLRRFIVDKLANRDTTIANAIIPLAIRDENPGIRLAAMAVLRHYRRAQNIGMLGIALRDSYDVIRATAANNLGQYRSARAGNYLQSALSDRSPAVRRARDEGLQRRRPFGARRERRTGESRARRDLRRHRGGEPGDESRVGRRRDAGPGADLG